jgi:vancomycin resistance protein YoaR
MAAIDEALSPQVDTPDAHPDTPDAHLMVSRPRVWLRLLAGFVLGLAVCLGLAAGALVAWDGGYEGRVLPGVHVGGIDLSGLDRAQASATLAAAFAGIGEGRVVLHTDAPSTAIEYQAFGRRADVDAMVDRALREGRRGTMAERAVGEVRMALEGTDAEPMLVLDVSALHREVVSALAGLERAPVDARVVKGPDTIDAVGSVAGRTYDADGAVRDALASVALLDAPSEIEVAVAGSDVPAAHPDAEALAAKAAAERMIGKVTVTFRDQHWAIKTSVVRSWIGFRNGADGSVEPAVDQTAIASALRKVAKGVHKDPVSAAYLGARTGHVVGVAAGHDGRDLDPARTASAIAQALMDRAGGAGAMPVAVEVSKVQPKLTTDKAILKAPLMQRLGSWKTWFPISDHNFFGANIWLPAKIIDGTVLKPGQTFEWWRAVGPVTTARGFGPGGYIAGDHTDPTGALGGGMCSSSTTLFNAALRAGLKMGSRVNHQYYIYRYPLGLDATVSKSSSGTRTMTFTNDTKHPIVIRTYRYTSGGRGWVRYEIWGIPDGRTVSIGAPVVNNVRQATTRIVYVTTLPHGVRNQTEYPADGMDVSVSRVVRDSHGRIIHQETYYSHYQLWDGIIQVGA